jgi:hypothetical protein
MVEMLSDICIFLFAGTMFFSLFDVIVTLDHGRTILLECDCVWSLGLLVRGTRKRTVHRWTKAAKDPRANARAEG